MTWRAVADRDPRRVRGVRAECYGAGVASGCPFGIVETATTLAPFVAFTSWTTPVAIRYESPTAANATANATATLFMKSSRS